MAITRHSREEGGSNVGGSHRNESHTQQTNTGRSTLESGVRRAGATSVEQKQALLNKLLEGRQTREVQQKIAELVNISPVLTTTKDRRNQLLEEDDADTPAWSRGRPPGTGTKRRATRTSELPTEGDELADFEDDLKPELEEIGTRKRLRSGTLVQQPHVGRAAKPKPTTRSSHRRASAPATVHPALVGTPVDSDVDEDDDEEAEEEEVDKTANCGRYPSRRRSRVDHFDPNVIYQARPPARRKVEVDSGEEDEEEEDEDDEGDGEEAGPSHRYPLRDRARVTMQPTPTKDAAPQIVRGAGRSRRLGFGGTRRGASRRPGPYHLDEDMADPDADWASMNVGEGNPRGEHSMRRAPWEAALGEIAVHDKRTDPTTNTEITPVQVDQSVDFSQVGGLDQYIKALKEMVFLPLVYPELFQRFHISPPRGVLFYGPPGTGKTLVARALASHASRAGKKVSFFMRKGADVLSKWVGEAERQLRLLFEEAQKNQPAIIFFDEIDGLAPVRSSKQDQIHNSIVSTLLALMDGLDSRGQVVLIGATNRIDALDSALRRPGRFDRELVFPLPNNKARAAILGIHTRKWAQPLPEDLRLHLADLCVGYCGADLKALCTEACLKALRRKYPQIYESEQKLLLDPGAVSVEKQDFLSAFNGIVPASHRSAASHSRPLSDTVKPALNPVLSSLLKQLCERFPPASAVLQNMDSESSNVTSSKGIDSGALDMDVGATLVTRPRLLLCGLEEAGQSHLAPALIHALEGLPVHSIGLPSLLSDASARSPEEAVVHAVVEARRSAPSILYLPHLTLWWETAPRSLQATLWMLLADLPADLALLLLSTADAPLVEIPEEALALFGNASQTQSFAYELTPPEEPQRRAMFSQVCSEIAGPAHQRPSAVVSLPPPQLPVAPEGLLAEEAAAKDKEAAELRRQWEDDESALRSLRMALREITTKLLCNRQWKEFWEPVDPEEDPHYYEQVKAPMDLGSILRRVDSQKYLTVGQFMADFGLISGAAKAYWEDDPQGLPEISRAKAMEDQTLERILARVPAEVRHKCEAIHAKGGPAPPPPGLDLPVGVPAINASQDKPTRPDWRPEAPAGKRKLRGSEVDDSLIFQDPEAIMRAKRQAQRKARESAQTTPTPEVQHQQVSLSRPPDLADGDGRDGSLEDPSPSEAGMPREVAVHVVGAELPENGEEKQVLQEIDPSENLIVPDSVAPQTANKRASAGGFKAALMSFKSAIGSDLFTPGTRLKSAAPVRSSILCGESAAELPVRAIDQKNGSPAAPLSSRTDFLETGMGHTGSVRLDRAGETASQPGPLHVNDHWVSEASLKPLSSPEAARPERAQSLALDPTEGLEATTEGIQSRKPPGAGLPSETTLNTLTEQPRVSQLLDEVVQRTDQCLIGALEDLHCRLARVGLQYRYCADRDEGVKAVLALLPSP